MNVIFFEIIKRNSIANTRKKLTEEGYKIYSSEELKIGKGNFFLKIITENVFF